MQCNGRAHGTPCRKRCRAPDCRQVCGVIEILNLQEDLEIMIGTLIHMENCQIMTYDLTVSQNVAMAAVKGERN